MEYFMVPLLIIISILSVMGTLYNRRTGNMPGLINGGAFTLGMIGVTLLSLYDFFIGIT